MIVNLSDTLNLISWKSKRIKIEKIENYKRYEFFLYQTDLGELKHDQEIMVCDL